LAEKLFLLKHIGYSRGIPQGQAQKAPEGLLCHNYRATAFQAVILSQQLKNLKNLIATYGSNAAFLRDSIKDIPGVRMQSPGRLSNPQGYYSFHLIFDGEPFKDIPTSVINEACEAEGFPIPNGTHGPVYKAALFNLNLEKGEYQISDGQCSVCEYLFTRTLGGAHTILTHRTTVEKLSAVLHKIYDNIDELKHYAATKK
jgi:dTDP-4-amino-4,6-dideoxygalactose transaminase